MTPGFLENRCEEKLYVFFDETNNLRKISLNITKDNGLNEANTLFVLGGVFFTYAIDPLRTKSKFQKFYTEQKVKLDGEKEYKFKEFANGGDGKSQDAFKKFLSGRKLNLFLKWLKKNRGYFHYSVTDLRYFIFVDLVESDELVLQTELYGMTLLNTVAKLQKIIEFPYNLKTYFDKILQHKQLELFKKLHSINFPDIQKVDIEVLRNIVTSHVDDYLSNHHPSTEEKKYLKAIDAILKNTDFFLMLTDPDKPHRLMDSFTSFYLLRLSAFYKSVIRLDNEYEIEYDFDLFKNLNKKRKESISELEELSKINYSFQKSDQNFLLQLSDITIGIIKEFYNFCLFSDVPIEDWDNYIKEFEKNLTKTQQENIRLFCELHKKSLSIYNGIQHTTTPLDGRKKFDVLVKYFYSI